MGEAKHPSGVIQASPLPYSGDALHIIVYGRKPGEDKPRPSHIQVTLSILFCRCANYMSNY